MDHIGPGDKDGNSVQVADPPAMTRIARYREPGVVQGRLELHPASDDSAGHGHVHREQPGRVPGRDEHPFALCDGTRQTRGQLIQRIEHEVWIDHPAARPLGERRRAAAQLGNGLHHAGSDSR